MIWHIITYDMSKLDDSGRGALEAEIAKVSGCRDVLWFQLKRDIERTSNTTTVAVFQDADGFRGYRADPIHHAAGDAVRAALKENYVVSNVNIEDMPLPA